MAASDTAAADSSAADAIEPASTNLLSLHRTVHARRSEYVRRHRMRIKVGTWNVAASPGTDKDLARWFVDEEGLDPALGPSKPANDAVLQTRGEGGSRLEDEDGPIRLGENGKVGLYVLGLQEVNQLSAPGQYMTWIYAADTTTTDRWKAALEAALPEDYQLVAAEQLAGMLLLAYASPEVAPTISNVSAASVGTGALGYLGNKGAVSVRMLLGEATQLVFVNCHLASGVGDYYVDRRIYQVQQIMSQTRFEPISIAGVSEEEKNKIGDEDFAFLFGDLNSRLDRLPGDDIRRLLMLHTRGEYDLAKKAISREDSLDGEPIVVQNGPDSSDEVPERETTKQSAVARPEDKAAESPSTDDDSLVLPDPDEFPPDPHEDPASLQSTLDSLLPHDQLTRLRKERRLLHEGWREGGIGFLPTYKYDIGTVALFDSSEKRRPPSWCDRILYRTRRDLEEYERRVKEEEETRKRDEEMKARGMDDPDDDDQVLFSYDPESDGEDPPSSAGLDYDEYDDGTGGGGDEQPQAQAEADRIHLNWYASHQRITSSDHKPVTCIFTIDYDAVVPELKAKIHAEVARELDRAENEGRPVITVVVDHHDPQRPTRSNSLESSGHVDFGEIKFLKRETASLTLANTGRVAATVSFVEKPTISTSDGEVVSLQWLKTSFAHHSADSGYEVVESGQEVTLEPGETVNAVLEALIDEIPHACMLNEGQTSLEEVLVLRVTDGRDHFIPVRATWAPTCIGRSVEELIRVPDGGVRAFAKSLCDSNGKLGAIPSDLPVHRPAPKELFQLTEALETLTQRALADVQMLEDFTIPSDPGWPFDEAACTSTDRDTRTAHVAAVLDALDRDLPLQSAFAPEISSLARLEATAQALLLFLRGLADGIVPAPLWERVGRAAPSLPSLASFSSSFKSDAPDHHANDDDDARTAILDILQSSPHHNICFVFLTTALARAVAELSPVGRGEWDLLLSLHSRNGAATAPAAAKNGSDPVAAAAAAGSGGGGGSPTASGGGGIRSTLGGAVLGFGAAVVSAATGGGGGGGGGGNNGTGRTRGNTRSTVSLWRSEGAGPAAAAAAATEAGAGVKAARESLERRRARERRVAEVFADVVCRGPTPVPDGGLGRAARRREAEGWRRGVVGVFLRGRG